MIFYPAQRDLFLWWHVTNYLYLGICGVSTEFASVSEVALVRKVKKNGRCRKNFFPKILTVTSSYPRST